MNIKQLRREFGLNQTDMASLLGLDQVRISLIETGKREETEAHLAHCETLELLRQAAEKSEGCDKLLQFILKLNTDRQ